MHPSTECGRPTSAPGAVPPTAAGDAGRRAAEPTIDPEVTVSDHLQRVTVSVLAGLFALALAAGGSEAQVRFGGQLNVADDTDFGLGPRVAVDFEELGPRFQVIGTWDIYFPDEEGLDYWELNGNLVYRFDLRETDAVVPYGGGGLNIARFDREGQPGGDVDTTELGLNVLAGAEFPLTSVTPFVELRVTAEGSEQLYLTGGILVP